MRWRGAFNSSRHYYSNVINIAAPPPFAERVMRLKPSATHKGHHLAEFSQNTGITPWNLTAGTAGSHADPHIYQQLGTLLKQLTKSPSDIWKIIQPFGTVGGEEPVRKVTADFLNKRLGDLGFGAKNVLLTTGAKEAIFTVAQLFCEKQSPVFLRNGTWSTYEEQIRLAGGNPVYIEGTGRKKLVTPKDIEQAIDDPAIGLPKYIILAPLENPDGANYTRDELKDIMMMLNQPRYQNILVLYDTSYRPFSDKRQAEASLLQEAGFDPNRLIVIFGAGKEALVDHSIRVGGLACTSHHIMKKAEQYQSATTTHSNMLGQLLWYLALINPNMEQHVNSYIEDTISKLKQFNNNLKDAPHLTIHATDGPYAYIEVAKEILENVQPVPGFNVVESFFLKQAWVAGIGGAAFSDGKQENCIRINIGGLTTLEDVDKVAKNIHTALTFPLSVQRSLHPGPAPLDRTRFFRELVANTSTDSVHQGQSSLR